MTMEASASGLLQSLQTDPFEPKDVIHFYHVLDVVRRERYLHYSQRELLVSLVRQVCMAIGNRDQYRSAHEDMMKILKYLRNLAIPESDTKEIKDVYQALIDQWVSIFGDPDEMERRQLERDAQIGIGESEEAREVRLRQEYIQNNFLRC